MYSDAADLTMPSERSDSAADGSRELVRQAQRGDAAAFERLYRLHVGRVYAVCLRLAADAALAERLTQDTFVRAWQRLDGFRGESAFGTWLYRIAVNVALTDARNKKRRAARISDEVAPEVSEGTSGPPLVDAAMDLEAGIAALPPQARAVLVLHDVEGYRHGIIAEQIGIAVGTSKAHLHWARTLLQEWLKR